MNRTALILAAGEGTRMESSLPKVLHMLKGRPLLSWVLDAIDETGFDRTIVVIGHEGKRVQEAVANRGVEFVWQREQKGTGHAVLQAAPLLARRGGSVAILSGDVPLVQAETLNSLLAEHEAAGASATVMTAEFDDPSGYGRIIRSTDGMIDRIVEQKDASETERRVKEINSGTYCFAVNPLYDVLPTLGMDNAGGEYYLTDVIARFRERRLAVYPFVVEDVWEIFGINTKKHLSLVEERIAGEETNG